jgi:hypothetical protein
MRSLLLSLVLVALSFMMKAQAYMESFEGGVLPSGWDTLNMSGPTPGTVPAWFPSTNYIAPPPALDGSVFFAASYEAEGNNGTISSWLFTPVRTLKNGDKFVFYTRTVSNTVVYPDRLEVRMSLNGASINTGTTSTSVGDFVSLIAIINQNLTLSGYPNTWTKYSMTLSGIPAAGASGRIAFRYYVTNSGPNGVNGDGVGIDSVHYQPNISIGVNELSDASFKVYPNPSQGHVNIDFANPTQRELLIQNMLGETVFSQTLNEVENRVDLSGLSKGLYLLNIKESNHVFTQKITLD